MARGKDVLDAIDRSASLRPRSSLHQWMFENHDAFQERLEEKLPDWTVLAKLFEEGGLTNRYGLPPKAETARKAWQTVRKDVAKARAEKALKKERPTTSANNSTRPTPTQDQSKQANDILGKLSIGKKLPDPIF